MSLFSWVFTYLPGPFPPFLYSSLSSHLSFFPTKKKKNKSDWCVWENKKSSVVRRVMCMNTFAGNGNVKVVFLFFFSMCTFIAVCKDKYITSWFSDLFTVFFIFLRSVSLHSWFPHAQCVFHLPSLWYPVSITVLQTGLVNLIKGFYAGWNRASYTTEAGMVSIDSSSQWRAKLSLTFLYGRVIFQWLIV